MTTETQSSGKGEWHFPVSVESEEEASKSFLKATPIF
jgi:hypothetical protein